MNIKLEFKPQDLWMGVFWKDTIEGAKVPIKVRWDLWICLIPMVPIHITWRTLKK